MRTPDLFPGRRCHSKFNVGNNHTGMQLRFCTARWAISAIVMTVLPSPILCLGISSHSPTPSICQTCLRLAVLASKALIGQYTIKMIVVQRGQPVQTSSMAEVSTECCCQEALYISELIWSPGLCADTSGRTEHPANSQSHNWLEPHMREPHMRGYQSIIPASIRRSTHGLDVVAGGPAPRS